MRSRLAWVLFALGVVVAGCGGGATSSLVPSSGGNAGSSGNAPASTKTTHANISLYVPPANKQASSRKPFYISPNTQSFGIVVLPYTSPMPSPLPTTNIQIFPVTTPSPCAIASGGGETCNFTVTAPVGNDLFVVAAFATAAPSGNTTPLSAFVSGEVTVSLSPAPGATPLAFTLDGIVYTVAVTVASPDPGNTPNTQVFTVGVPTSAPIGVTAYDSSGNLIMSDPTTPYYNPIVIQASPASDGLTLSLIGSSSCGSSASGATATLNCAGDLSNVQVSYDGTPRPDANDHLLDNYSVSSTTAPNPTPSPANYVLASNIESWQLNPGNDIYEAYLGSLSSGAFWYLAYLESGNNWITGTFDPSTGTASAAAPLPVASGVLSATTSSTGNLWIVDAFGSGPSTIACYTSPSSGGSQIVTITPHVSNGDPVRVSAIAIDNTGTFWYVGYDDDAGGMYGGYFPVPSGCAVPNPNPPTPQFTLTNNSPADYFAALTPIPGGGATMIADGEYGHGVWVMTPTGPTTVSPVTPVLSSADGYGIAVDGAGTTYAGFAQGSTADVETLASGGVTLSTLLDLPPNPATNGIPSPMPSAALNAFSPSGGAADRLEYTDVGYEALGLIESVPASPMPILVSLPNSAYVLPAAYNAHGGEYVLDMDANSNLNIVRVMPTKTWSVPNISLNSACQSAALLTILERGDSGPFTVSIPGGVVTATQVPGADHDFWLAASGTVSFTATVTDAHGRTESFNVTSTPSYVTCGAAHRRIH
ncbi:MAG: hypothetical protein WBG27_06350 [Candidatus Aquilonibacter sp.]